MIKCFSRTDLLPDLVGDLIPILPLVHIFLILLVHPGRVSGASRPSEQPSYQRGDSPRLLPYSQLIYPVHLCPPRSIICLWNTIVRLFRVAPMAILDLSKCKNTPIQPQNWPIWSIFPNNPDRLPEAYHFLLKKTEIVRDTDDPSPLGALSYLWPHFIGFGQIFVHDSRVKSTRKHLRQLIASAILYIFGKTDFNRNTICLPEAFTAAAAEWLCLAQCRVAELSWLHCNSLCLF